MREYIDWEIACPGCEQSKDGRLTSISEVGEKESFLVDCWEAWLGLKLKGLARRQNSFLSGHKPRRIEESPQGNELTIYEYQRPFPTPGVIVRSTTTSQADLEAQLNAHFLAYWILKSTGTVPPRLHTDRTSGKHNSFSRKDIRFIS